MSWLRISLPALCLIVFYVLGLSEWHFLYACTLAELIALGLQIVRLTPAAVSSLTTQTKWYFTV